MVGQIRFAAGDFSGALADLGKAVGADKFREGAASLLLYFARQRGGSPFSATDNLEALATSLAPDAAYLPITQFFLGKLSITEARNRTKSDYICFADALVGEWHIANGILSEGRATLKQVLDKCPKYRYSYALAKSELKRLKP